MDTDTAKKRPSKMRNGMETLFRRGLVCDLAVLAKKEGKSGT
jgi:hypothetical protein